MADGPSLTLPPLYRELCLSGRGTDVPADARARAAELGAGTLLWAERPGVVSLAVVLEPEAPLAAAREALLAGMSALAEAVATRCLPERAVTLEWPDTLLYDGARLGGGALAWPEPTPETAVPEWLVFWAELIRDRDDLPEPGRFPASTSLAEEEIGPVPALIEDFAAHLMRNFDTWSALGREALAARYLSRLAPDTGTERRLAPGGDLLERSEGGVETRRDLVRALSDRRWHDPARGGPRL